MYSQKDIRITFILNSNSFEDGKDTKIIEGLACSFNIEQVASPDFSKCSGKIYNISIEDAAKLTTLSFDPLTQSRRNYIKIEVTENKQDYTTVFIGNIEQCFADLSGAPDVALNINAISGSYAMRLPASATSIKGEVSAMELFSKLVDEAGFKLECNINDTVKNIFLQGSVMQQIYGLARSINAKVIIDNDVLKVLKQDEGLKGGTVLLNKDTGLIGYPSFNNVGIVLACQFNPNIKQQGLIKVESIVPKASGVWRVIKLNHTISANMPSGSDWKSQIEGAYNV